MSTSYCLVGFFEECIAEKQSEEDTDEGVLQFPQQPVTQNGQQVCSDQTLWQEDVEGAHAHLMRSEGGLHHYSEEEGTQRVSPGEAQRR